ncbi:hypothetical protein BDW22DRAFT_1206213 [Trametopsis cervina]|nr:hypothetical protein BDW22DRAFT_1206213 [Trametopsis cervina]
MRIRDPAVPVGNSEANMEEAKHRWALHYLRAEARSRSSNSEVPSSSVDIICEYIEHVLEAFDIMSTSLPIFKVALVLMSAVQKSLKTLNNVDEAIKNLFRMLSETIKKAQACCTSQPDSRFPDIFERIARLAVTSAAVVDRWMRKNTLLRVFAAGHVQDGLKRCQCDLKKVQDELQFDLAAHPRAPESTAASVATAQPEPTVLDTPEVTQEEPSGWRQSFHNGVNVWSIFPTRRTPSPPHGFIRSEPKRQDSDRARSPSPVGSLFAASRDPQRYLGTASFEEQPCTPPRGLAMPLPRVPVAPTMPLPNASEEYVVVSEPLTESNPYEHWNYGTQDDQDSAPPPYPMDYYAADDWHRGYTHPQA